MYGGGGSDERVGSGGGGNVPAGGVGCGDAGVVALVWATGRLPQLPASGVECVVFAMEVDARQPSIAPQ